MGPGVDTGTRVRVAGQGEAGARGAPPGDLYLYITVAEHDVFYRDGAELGVEVPVTFSQAALGAEVAVESGAGALARIPDADYAAAGAAV